jgi:hypothetical protein
MIAAAVAIVPIVIIATFIGKFASADSAPVISEINPAYGNVGDLFTVYGQGFNASSEVYVDNRLISNSAISGDKSSISFIIPSVLNGACSPDSVCSTADIPVTSSQYTVNISNQNGVSSAYTFAIGTSNSSSSNTPIISSISPQKGPAETLTVIYGSGFSTTSPNTVTFGYQPITATFVSTDGDTISFTTPKNIEIGFTQSLLGHGIYSNPIGTYEVSVSNKNGTSSKIEFDTTDGSSSITTDTTGTTTTLYSPPHISSISPKRGTSGIIITLTGSGFDPADGHTYVVFNGNEITGQSASNGSLFSFKLPQLDGLEDGTNYPVYVQANNHDRADAASNVVSFTYESSDDAAITTSSGSSGSDNPPSGVTGSKGFVDNGDGTVTDKSTSLTWQQCVNGASSSDCSTGEPTVYSFVDATAACASLNLGGYSGWRLPTLAELAPFEYYLDNHDSIHDLYFPNDDDNFFWTSTSYGRKTKGIPKTAKFVVFSDGTEDLGFSFTNFAARCVRDNATSYITPPEANPDATDTSPTSIPTVTTGGGTSPNGDGGRINKAE